MTVSTPDITVRVGVLALQGAFSEHIQPLRAASTFLASRQHGTNPKLRWSFIEVRTPQELSACDALIIPGGESTTMSLVAARSGLLEPLREFVKVLRRPTWGTCAGLILLAESANRTKKGGQDLIGGLDVRVNRNHFGRQVESFQSNLHLPFLDSLEHSASQPKPHPYRCVFIRAPVVEKILPHHAGIQLEEYEQNETIVAPSQTPKDRLAAEQVTGEVEVMAKLGMRNQEHEHERPAGGTEDIIAVRQGNVFGTSFHPELTDDPRIHVWWLEEVLKAVERRREFEVADRTTTV